MTKDFAAIKAFKEQWSLPLQKELLENVGGGKRISFLFSKRILGVSHGAIQKILN